MSESAKFDAYKNKLQGVCDENNLAYQFDRDQYPITLTIRPLTGLQDQMSFVDENEEEANSPDAAIVFAMKDGFLTYKTSETFTISDALFSKVKNLFKNMHSTWLQFFFREVLEKGLLSSNAMPDIPAPSESEMLEEEPLDDPDEDMDVEDPSDESES